MKILHIVLLTIICVISSSYSYGISQKEINMLNNIQNDYTDCAAYYHISSQCFLEKKDKTLQNDLKNSATIAMYTAMEIGAYIGMTEDAIKSRLEMSSETMNDLIKSNCINISSLLKRYTKNCKSIVENYNYVIKNLKPKQ